MDQIEKQTMLPIGTMLHDTYRVDKYLSSGGFGNTYVVTNLQFDEQLALKEFFMKGISQRDDQTTVSVSNADNQEQFDSQLEKFKKEARRLRKLENENIVRVHDLFEENGTAYYVMDLIDGESLSAMMKRLGRPLTEKEVMTLLPQVLNALEGMHSQQIWHLDLKPGNIMVNRQGRAVLIDFGASKQMNASQGYTGTSSAMCYTPGYAPTEQIDGTLKRIGPWTDFYALGATVYNLLTRQQPPSTTEVMTEGVSAFQFPASMSNGMRQLVVWLMDARPASRPQSVAAIRNGMSQMMKSQQAETPKPANIPASNGTQLHQTGVNKTGPTDAKPVQAKPASAPAPAQKKAEMVSPIKPKSNKGIFLAIGGVLFGLLLIAVIGGGCLFYYYKSNYMDSDEMPVYSPESPVMEVATEEDEYDYFPQDQREEALRTADDGYEQMLSDRRLSESDLYGKTKTDLEIMRNSIYARYGYRFKRQDLLDHFSQFSWYTPTTSDMTSAYSRMSDIEKYNIEFIKRHE